MKNFGMRVLFLFITVVLVVMVPIGFILSLLKAPFSFMLRQWFKDFTRLAIFRIELMAKIAGFELPPTPPIEL